MAIDKGTTSDPATMAFQQLQAQMNAYQAAQAQRLEDLQKQIEARWKTQEAPVAEAQGTGPAIWGVQLWVGGPVGGVKPTLNIADVPIDQLGTVIGVALNLLLTSIQPQAGTEVTLLAFTGPLLSEPAKPKG